MRSIFPTGVLQAFTDRNYFPWKLMIGSSGGALTGAAYAAHQIHIARDAMFGELLSNKFIHFANIFDSKKHILDLDWMLQSITNGEVPLDKLKLKKSCKVIITATHCRNNNYPSTIYLDTKKDDLMIALKATSALPFLYRGFVNYKQYNLLDGGLLDPIPYKKALELGFKPKEILVVTTRPRGYRKKEESFWIKTLYELYYNAPEYRFLTESLEKRYLRYNDILDELEGQYSGIEVIYPSGNFRVERLTRDKDKILQGFENGIHAAHRFLDARLKN